METPTHSDPQGDALEKFAAWLARREAGEEIEFEDFAASEPALAAELRELHASWKRMSEAGELSALPSSSPRAARSKVVAEFLARRAVRARQSDRYRLEGEVARGGMGAILRVWDTDLRRHLAMKVALADEPEASVGDSPNRSGAARLSRFLEEARVTGRLDHPGIVPVHELGLDAEGRLYFTMKLVEGRDMKQIFELVFAGRDDWNQTRALGVILKVCEAMAYAHAKGVIHRDLKPANVMVGSFGEVFVMDWGLARVLERADPHDLRLAGDAEFADSPSRADGAEELDDRLMTVDGVVLGTPAYMPPEQARGEIEKLSPRSDVYSIGAMLYHLLGRRAPYVVPGARTDHRRLLDGVRAGPPTPLHELNAEIPAELAAICDKAMAREPSARYPDTLEFAADLRAYLEHRVVAAYETGAVAELRKWIARNRSLAAALASAIAILIAAVVVSSSLFFLAKRESDRADSKASEAENERRIAAQRADDVLSLSAARDLAELVDRADLLWPARSENIAAYEQWLRDAHTLIDGRAADPVHNVRAKPSLADHKRKLAELEARALSPTDGERAAAAPNSARSFRFANGDDAWWHAQLASLVADLEAFANPESGLCSGGTDRKHGWGVERRLELARTLGERTVNGTDAARRWREAIDSIRDRAQCPKYDGMVIAPQLGLLPIGRDPQSGLWEFAHVPTGEPAQRGSDGALAMKEGTGLVFVLVPAGAFWMGAQKSDPAAHNFDPECEPTEGPVNSVSLDAYFLSKYEMTQDQWQRFTGNDPSEYAPPSVHGGRETTLLHPVESVSWIVATEVLRRLDLLLPTEAQWERGARADTETTWWTGSEPSTLQGAANVADAYAKLHNGPPNWAYTESLDDGYLIHAPVGTFRANGFGLHDTIGNVFELCRDGWGTYDAPVRAGDGEREVAKANSHMIRGGSYLQAPKRVRSSYRVDVTPSYHDFSVGIRPARKLERE